MPKVRTFDPEVLHEHYSQSQPLDLTWLGKSSRHQFRWRCTRNRWHTSGRQIRNGEALAKVTKHNTPRDMYVSTSAWLNPVKLPKIKDKKTPAPVMIDHLIVFDIDIPPFSRRNMERARKAAVDLLDWVEQHHDFERVHFVFSGSKGFHLIFRDNDRSLFGIPDPRQREQAVRKARQNLLKETLAAGHPVDKGITADTRRIIRLPGSLHGSTGWFCSIISEQQLRAPFRTWVKGLDRHAGAIKMPWHARLKKKKTPKTNAKTEPEHQEVASETFTSLEASTHVPGTKDRSAIFAWLPRSWGSIEETIERAVEKLSQFHAGPVLFWTDQEAVLMLVPRAFPRVQAAKMCRKIGLLQTALSMESNDHNWVRFSPRQGDESGWESEFEPLGVRQFESERATLAPWSSAHLELAQRLNLIVDAGEEDRAGSNDPMIRVVRRN